MNKLLARVGAALIITQTLLFILSWILSAMRLSGVRSLLSSEGIRWFFGAFTANVASPWLVSLLLILIALGTLRNTGLLTIHSSLFTFHFSLFTFHYREKVAMRVSLIVLCLFVVMIALLTLPPHAILLSATGSLFPSAFSRALVPILAFGLCLLSISFGMVSGRLRTLSDILDALTFGIQQGAPLFILYIMAIQFYASLLFVFIQ